VSALEVPDSHRDLLEGKVATLATIGSDGRPQVSAAWFLADDDGLGTSLNSSRQKTKNLLANPACSLIILDLAQPHRYLEVGGDAELVPDPEYRFADRLGAKYQIDLRVLDGPGETRYAVRIDPVRVVAVNALG